MFDKKKCKRCGRKTASKDSFCPRCGFPLGDQEREDEWGMLGKNDFVTPEIAMPGFNNLFNSIMKDFGSQFGAIEKELKKGIENPKSNKRGISISISTSGNTPPKIQIRDLNGLPIGQTEKKVEVRKKESSLSSLSEEKSRAFSTLPQEEPVTQIRRLSNKVIYEINLPGVKSLKDVSIMQLEKSIELKAITKNKAYKKVIPIDFPIQKYKLSKEKLILELGVKN